MTNKSTKRALLTSLLALVVCISMLVGTTFAWFTDSVTSGSNKIQAGNLDVKLLLKNESGKYVEISNESAPIFGNVSSLATPYNADTVWEPGKTQVAYLAIENAGSLDLKYAVSLNVKNPSNSKNLYEVMSYDIIENKQEGVDSWTSGERVTVGKQIVAKDVALENGHTHYFALAIHMDETADNRYQDGLVEFDLTVYATQLTSESDSFDNTYDKDAKYDYEAPTSEDTVTGLTAAMATDGVITLSKGGSYVLSGDFSDISIVTATGADTVIDGSNLSSAGKLTIGSARSVDNLSEVSKDNARTGSIVIKNVSNTEQISVNAVNTAVEISDNTVEYIDIDGGNAAITLKNNTVTGGGTNHKPFRHSENGYGIYITSVNYDLKFIGNTISGTLSHAIAINGKSADGEVAQGADGSQLTNTVSEFSGNTVAIKSGKAALKIWSDTVYAPATITSADMLSQEANELVALVRSSNNSFSGTESGNIFNLFDYKFN